MELLVDIWRRICTAQVRVARAANTKSLRLYWSVSQDILIQQEQESWCAGVAECLSADFQREFPGIRG